ncbi:MAG: hypothetical protein WCE46_02540 [Methanoregula sp.]|uniref:hypothetical protein n=1 Tax=Methanoregula sp. TaxID=2052170 RepID=UPI003C7896FB
MDNLEQDVGKEWQDHLAIKSQENYRDELVASGIVKEQADQLAGIVPPAKTEEIAEDPVLKKAREDYRDTLIECGTPSDQAIRLAGIKETEA